MPAQISYMEPDNCPVCAAAEKLGFNPEQARAFHAMAFSQLAAMSAAAAAEDLGINVEDEIFEATFDNVLDQLCSPHIPANQLN